MNWEERKQAYLNNTALPPIVEFLNISLLSAGHGKARLSLQPRPEMANAMGTLHGGILCDLGDAAMGYALASTLHEGETFSTLELHINFLRSVTTQPLIAEASVVKRSRNVGYIECSIADDRQQPVARLSSTCLLQKSP